MPTGIVRKIATRKSPQSVCYQRSSSPSVPAQAAQLHYPPLNYFLLSSPCQEPNELSPQGGTITRLLPYQLPSNNSFARAIEAAHGVRSLLSKDKIVTNDTEKKKKGPVYKLAWGSLFAKGLKKRWERKCFYEHVRKITSTFVNSRKLLVTSW